MSDARDRIKQLAERVRASTPRGKKGKSNRTFVAHEPEYRILVDYCRTRGIQVSEVLNELIAVFLETVKDDLPPDLTIRDDESA
jgi:hypothetical protein